MKLTVWNMANKEMRYSWTKLYCGPVNRNDTGLPFWVGNLISDREPGYTEYKHLH